VKYSRVIFIALLATIALSIFQIFAIFTYESRVKSNEHLATAHQTPSYYLDGVGYVGYLYNKNSMKLYQKVSGNNDFTMWHPGCRISLVIISIITPLTTGFSICFVLGKMTREDGGSVQILTK
jgi:hypothetical protein